MECIIAPLGRRAQACSETEDTAALGLHAAGHPLREGKKKIGMRPKETTMCS